MNAKLSFLRNPRHPLPPAVQLLQSQIQPRPQWDRPPARQLPPPTIKHDMTSRAGEVFVVEPAEVVFTDYGGWWAGCCATGWWVGV